MSAVTEPRPAYFPSATSIPSPRSPFEHPAARRPVHEPSTTSANPGPDPEVEAAALRLRQDLEWRIFDRAREMNVRHADAAWERRYQRPLGPYGLAFLFRPARPPQGPQTVAAATKLWLAGPDPADPVDLLGALADLARSRRLRPPAGTRRRDAARRPYHDGRPMRRPPETDQRTCSARARRSPGTQSRPPGSRLPRPPPRPTLDRTPLHSASVRFVDGRRGHGGDAVVVDDSESEAEPVLLRQAAAGEGGDRIIASIGQLSMGL
jgi:hypothetical protein